MKILGQEQVAWYCLNVISVCLRKKTNNRTGSLPVAFSSFCIRAPPFAYEMIEQRSAVFEKFL